MKRLTALFVSVIMLLALLPTAALAETTYSLVCDTSRQTVVAYKNGKPVRYMLCSTGKAGTSTNEGDFQLTEMRERFGYFVASGDYAAYWVHFGGDLYFHSVVFEYDEYMKHSMLEDTYNKLGQRASGGCVRLMVEDAQWVFYNCPAGTKVKIGSGLLSAADRTKAAARVPKFADYELPPDLNAAPDNAVVKFNAATTLYDGAGYRKKTVGSAAKGAKAEVLQKRSLWSKVRLLDSDTIGYVYTRYTTDTGETLPQTIPDMSGSRVPPEITPYEYETVKHVMSTSAAGANIYEKNSSKSTKLGLLPLGHKLEYVSETASYYRVRFGGTLGSVPKSRASIVYSALPKQTDKPATFTGAIIKTTPYYLDDNADSFMMGELKLGSRVFLLLDGYSDGEFTKIYRDGGICYVPTAAVVSADKRGDLTPPPEDVSAIAEKYDLDMLARVFTRWTDGVDIKAYASNSAKTIGKLTTDSPWGYAGETKSYYRIDFNGTPACVRKVDAYMGYSLAPKQIEQPESVPGMITRDNINVFCAKDIHSHSFGKLYNGDVLAITEKGKTWTAVYFCGGICYVKTAYIKEIEL